MSSVDVIVPCYRYGRYLRECVESVLTQSLKDVRVLILDDASPDNTAEVAAELAREDSRVTFTRHPVNKGHIATYNEGIEWISGDYMLLLSADDFLLPGAFDRAVALLDANPDVGFVFGRAIRMNPEGTQSSSESIAVDGNVSPERIVSGVQFVELCGSSNLVPTPTAIVRTALQKKVGGYNPALPHSGDMEMWLRLAAHGSVGILDAAQAVYRIHTDNMSHAYFRQRRLLDLMQRKAAFESFWESDGHKMANADGLHRSILSCFARDAVSYASAAFNDGEMELVDQFTDFAVGLSPSVKNSLPWAKLSLKQKLGYKRWNFIQSTVGKWLVRRPPESANR